MVSEAVISVKGTTSGNVPISTAFMNQAEYKRTGLMKARQQFRYTVSIGIQKDAGGSYPEYNTPYGYSESLLKVIEYLREKGFEPLQPIMDKDARREIQEFIQRQSYQYVVYGMKTMKKVLRDECEKWVKKIREYIAGFKAPRLKESTVEQRKSKKKHHGEYYKYDGGIRHPLMESGLLMDSIGYKIEELKDSFGGKDNSVIFKKRETRGRPSLSDAEKKKREKATRERATKKAKEKKQEAREIRAVKKEEEERAKQTAQGSHKVFLGSTKEEIEAIKNDIGLTTDFLYIDTDKGNISIPGIEFNESEKGVGHVFTREAVLNAQDQLERISSFTYPKITRALNTLVRLSRLHILDDFLNPNKGEGK